MLTHKIQYNKGCNIAPKSDIHFKKKINK